MDAPPAAPSPLRLAFSGPMVTATVSAPSWGARVSEVRVATSPLDFLPKHNPTVAMCLSLAVDGAGQFYDGETVKGWWMLGSWLLYPVAWGLDTAFRTGYFRSGALVVELGVKGYSAWDAYHAAEAYRRQHPGAR